MQGPFGPQRDPHQDWVNRMEEGAAYEEWKEGRGQGGMSGAGQVLAWIVFLGFVLLIILFIVNAR